MKKIYSIILTIAGLAVLSGCNNRADIETPAGDIRLRLRIEGAELVTKATEEGEDTFNENTIKTIHYYFFDQTDSTYVYDGTQTINKTDGAEISLSGISNSDFSNIFSSGRTELFTLVVVNATTPDGTSSPSYYDVMETVLALTGFGKQDNLVMAGTGTLTKGSSVGTVLTASTDDIELKRLASKITLHLIIPDKYIDGASREWIPQLNSVQIDFKNMGKNCLLSGKKAASPVLGNVTRKAKASDSDLSVEDAYDSSTPPVKTGNKVSLVTPVYSYPRVWNNGDSDTPYIYVTIPWKETGASADPSMTYYKILLPGTSLDQNTWYDITAKLGGLGSLTKEGTVDIPDLSINVSKTWKDAIGEGKNNTDADMAMPRVLAVEQNTYILYNQNSVEIPFVSSHNCDISSPSASEISGRGLPANQDSGANTTSSISVDNTRQVICFTHTLTNMPETGTTYDYKEFIHTYKLVHHTDASMYEYITIIQKPALCVTTETYVTGSPDNAKNTIFIDGVSFASATNTYRVLSTSKTEGTLTRVTASVLPESGIISSYILGDVRSKTNSMGTAPFVTGGDVNVRANTSTETFINTSVDSRRLTYYYPASEDAGNVIAPEFLIASSLPGVGGRLMNYEQAQLRCATFQEEGYPAGRWRLPTYAEMRFIFKLQLDGKIGTVFDVTNSLSNTDNFAAGYTPYACADGNFYRTNSGKTDIVLTTPRTGASGTVITGSVRCVYDSWYWDNTSVPRLPSDKWETFTWGDQEITW